LYLVISAPYGLHGLGGRVTVAWRRAACRRVVRRGEARRSAAWRSGVATLSIALGWPAATPAASAQESPEQELPPVVVTARKPVRQTSARRTVQPQQTATQPAAPASSTTTETAAPTAAASEAVLPRERVNAQPALRPGEVLEATPGLIVT